MKENRRVMLVTPGSVQLHPFSDNISAWTQKGLHAARVGTRPPEFDFLATGSVAGDLATKVLLDAVDGADGEEVLLLALATYDWLHEVAGLPPRVIALLPSIGRGVLMIVPEKYKLELRKPAQDCSVRDDLAHFGRREVPLRIVRTAVPVAEVINPFEPPLLTPAAHGKHAWIRRPFDKLWLNEIEADTPMATAIRSGVAQMNDLLEESHELSQSIEGHPDGDYWHAIMHRREPDYGNSKYWFRHVGKHPIFVTLAERAAAILKDGPAEIASRWGARLKVDTSWDPFAFVEMCEAAAGDEDGDLDMTARRIQWAEMLLLLKHTAGQLRT